MELSECFDAVRLSYRVARVERSKAGASEPGPPRRWASRFRQRCLPAPTRRSN